MKGTAFRSLNSTYEQVKRGLSFVLKTMLLFPNLELQILEREGCFCESSEQFFCDKRDLEAAGQNTGDLSPPTFSSLVIVHCSCSYHTRFLSLFNVWDWCLFHVSHMIESLSSWLKAHLKRDVSDLFKLLEWFCLDTTDFVLVCSFVNKEEYSLGCQFFMCWIMNVSIDVVWFFMTWWDLSLYYSPHQFSFFFQLHTQLT